MELSIEEFKSFYLKMNQIRHFEQQIHQFYLDGKLHGTTHLYVGQEASAVGICAALLPDDIITSTHRNHGHAIAKGTPLTTMMAEILGRQTGCCKGRGGSMHLCDVSIGNYGGNGVVGGGQSIATGIALTQKMKHLPNITVCFFGDGATNEGSFHEALNLASIWKLPVLFVCENNQYGLSMPTKKAMNVDCISQRAVAYGIPGKTIDGNRFDEVYAAAVEARTYVQEQGPMLLVCDTYRTMGHSKSDDNGYRPKEEMEYWRTKDPIAYMETYLMEKGVTSSELEALEVRSLKDVAAAVSFAENSSYPPLSDLTTEVYAHEGGRHNGK